MTEPERIDVAAPALFGNFSERRTRGQRRRALANRIIGPPYRVYERLRGRR